jgi:galactose mutarotase-like enzyme
VVYTEYFKGCESVVLENELLRVVVLPSIGGKIASIYKKDKQFELLFQNKEELYRKANVYDPFGKFDVSGFDDAFPTIDYCTVAFKNKDVNYPDHGEIWSMGFDYKKTDNELTLCSESSILPYNYRKSVRLDGDIVICNYEIISTGDEDFPCLWAMHCLINIEKDMKFIFPDGTDEVLNVLNSRNLGEKGTVHSFHQASRWE